MNQNDAFPFGAASRISREKTGSRLNFGRAASSLPAASNFIRYGTSRRSPASLRLVESTGAPLNLAGRYKKKGGKIMLVARWLHRVFALMFLTGLTVVGTVPCRF